MMHRIARLFLWGLVFSVFPVLGQKISTERVVKKLASDRMEGRLTGTMGEARAGRYIARKFRKLRLKPYLGEYEHYFFFTAPLVVKKTSLTIGRSEVAPNAYRWLAYAPRIKGKGIPLVFLSREFWTGAGEGGESRDVNMIERAVVIREPLADSIVNQLPDHLRTLKDRLHYLETFTPALLIILPANRDTYRRLRTVKPYADIHTPTLVIDPAWASALQRTTKVSFKFIPGRASGIGANLIGMIDNGASKSIVLGAHYDHLGRGEFGNSADPDAVGSIHNGADDNASGVAALLKTAELLKEKDIPWANFIFIAFSGEELGLLGSKAVWKDQVLDSTAVIAMINFDMVGRYDPSRRTLFINGTQSAQEWHDIIEKTNTFGWNLRTHSQLQGGSDHITFIYKHVPAIHFFTGLHADYHKPSDDADKVFAPGIDSIAMMAAAVAEQLAGHGKLTYQAPRATGGRRWKRKVSLRVMPDYAYDGEGFRIEQVLEDGPAYHAKLRAGDIIIRIGKFPIRGMQDYMKALAHYNPGQIVLVEFKRNDKVMRARVQF